MKILNSFYIFPYYNDNNLITQWIRKNFQRCVLFFNICGFSLMMGLVNHRGSKKIRRRRRSRAKQVHKFWLRFFGILGFFFSEIYDFFRDFWIFFKILWYFLGFFVFFWEFFLGFVNDFFNLFAPRRRLPSWKLRFHLNAPGSKYIKSVSIPSGT